MERGGAVDGPGAGGCWGRRGRGKAVVLMHGFFGGKGYWLPQIAHLSRQFEVIAIDLPGFGGCKGEVQHSIEEFAASVMRLVSALGVERFALVGHSMGGMIAQQMALEFTGRIERLVLYGTAGRGALPDRFETNDATISRIESLGLEAVADSIVATWFVDGKHHPYYELCRDIARRADPVAAVSAQRAVAAWDVRSRLREIRLPTLIVGSDMDRSIAVDELLTLWRGIEGSKLCVLPGCAHNAHLERAELFNGVVTEFLLGLTEGPRRPVPE